MAAEQGAVAGSCGAALGPVSDVVGFAPGCRDGAVRERAATVPGNDGFADVGRKDPGGAPNIQHARVTAQQDGQDVGIAGDFADGVGVDRPGEGRRARAEACYFAAASSRDWAGELFEEIAIADGYGELGPQSTIGGQFAGGHCDAAGTHQAVEEFLGPGTAIQFRTRGVDTHPVSVIAATGARYGWGESWVGGHVHGSGECLVLFSGREDFDVVQSVTASTPEEGTLDLSEDFLGGFGSVVVDYINPACSHFSDEVRVGLDRGGGQSMFHPGEGLVVGELPDFVQGIADDGG